MPIYNRFSGEISWVGCVLSANTHNFSTIVEVWSNDTIVEIELQPEEAVRVDASSAIRAQAALWRMRQTQEFQRSNAPNASLGALIYRHLQSQQPQNNYLNTEIATITGNNLDRYYRYSNLADYPEISDHNYYRDYFVPEPSIPVPPPPVEPINFVGQMVEVVRGPKIGNTGYAFGNFTRSGVQVVGIATSNEPRPPWPRGMHGGYRNVIWCRPSNLVCLPNQQMALNLFRMPGRPIPAPR